MLILFRSFLPDFKYILCTGTDFAILIVWQHRVHQSLIQCQLAAIVSDKQHIVYAGINHTITHTLSSFREVFHHFHLIGRRLQHNIMIICFRNRQLEHIRCLNISEFLIHLHKLRYVYEFAETILHLKAVSCRLYL